LLRFLAAAAVVAFHAWGIAPKYISVPPDTLSFGLPHAGHGVDLFFVISGFIIFYATQRPISPAAFLRRRIERIVPLYFFVIFALTLLAITLPATFGTPHWFTPRHILKSLAFISFTDGEMPVVYLGWSLEYEMYFYLAVALLIAFSRNVWRDIVVMFSALTIAGQIPGIASALGHYAFFVDPLILEFVFGVLVGSAFIHRRIDWPMLLAAGAAIATLLVTDPSSRAIVYGLPSAALVAAAAWISRVRPDASWAERALARLGDASYSIYLAQVNTVSLAANYVADVMPEIAPLALVAVVTCLVVTLGLLLNITVERPLLTLSRRIGAPRVAKTAAA
ncbi:MAG: acyltransferase family protein, partial [Xanthobacteraceae bacterium]